MSKQVRLNGSRAYQLRVKARLFESQNGLCHWCKEPMTMDKQPDTGPISPFYATFEHTIPKLRGGTGSVKNLKLACQMCNSMGGILYHAIDIIKEIGGENT